MPARRSLNPNKIYSRKRCSRLLLQPLHEQLRPSRTELKKAKQERNRNSQARASAPSPSAVSSKKEKFKSITRSPDQPSNTPGLPSEISIAYTAAKNQGRTTATQGDLSGPLNIPFEPVGKTQAESPYGINYNQLNTPESFFAPPLGPVLEGSSQFPASSLTSTSTIQASRLRPDIDDGILFPEPDPTSLWTEFCIPSAPLIQRSPGSAYAQGVRNSYYDLTWSPNMNSHQLDQYVQGIHPEAPPLITATYDNGHQSRQAAQFDDTLSCSFITQRSVDILKRSSPSPIEVIYVPPGIYDKTRCPDGTLAAIERVLYAKIEFESPRFQLQATRVCFVVYHDDSGSGDGIQMTLGHNWATKIEQAYA